MKTQENIILLADAYKYSHHKLYYPGTSKIYSYFESRGGEFTEIVFFGLQYFLKHYLEGQAITKEKIDAAEKIMLQVFGRNDVFDRTNLNTYFMNMMGNCRFTYRQFPKVLRYR